MMFGVFVSMVHEQHHDRACEKEQKWQHAEQMRSILGEQKESGHGTKTHCRKAAGRAQER